MKKKILFVDDEADIREMLRRMLRKQQDVWDMRFVGSAAEALEAVQANSFDAIVSDVRMPGMDGFGLLERLRADEKTKDIPIIILTGEGEPSLKRRALDMGATDLLNKPCDHEDLLARVRNVLRIKSYEDRLRLQNEVLEQRVRERTSELEESRREIIWRLAKAGEYRDDTTGDHIARVGYYSRLLAQGIGLEPSVVEMVFLTSPLHDIGKIGVPDSILRKKGRLDPSERTTIERHPAIGTSILTQASKGMDAFLAWQYEESSSGQPDIHNPLTAMAASIALNHHERWDGRGYPGRLSGAQIPIEARIVALADVYDALSSDRPYKPAYPEEKVLAIIRDEAGRHFDPGICQVFEEAIDEIRAIGRQFPENIGHERARTAK